MLKLNTGVKLNMCELKCIVPLTGFTGIFCLMYWWVYKKNKEMLCSQMDTRSKVEYFKNALLKKNCCFQTCGAWNQIGIDHDHLCNVVE